MVHAPRADARVSRIRSTTTAPELRGQIQPDGIGLATMPIGINHIESVNVYIVEDGDSVTLVDCGMWHPGEPDDGLSTLRHALNTRGYVLDDIVADLRHPRPHRPLRHGRATDGTHRRRAAHARHDRSGLRKVPAS